MRQRDIKGQTNLISRRASENIFPSRIHVRASTKYDNNVTNFRPRNMTCNDHFSDKWQISAKCTKLPSCHSYLDRVLRVGEGWWEVGEGWWWGMIWWVVKGGEGWWLVRGVEGCWGVVKGGEGCKGVLRGVEWGLVRVGLLSHVSCLMSPVSSLLSQVSCLTSLVSPFLSNISCLKSPVSRLTSPVSHLLSHVSYFKYPVSRLLSHVFCLTSSVLRVVSLFIYRTICIVIWWPSWLSGEKRSWRSRVQALDAVYFSQGVLKIPKSSAINAWMCA